MNNFKARVPYWKAEKNSNNEGEIKYVDEEFHPMWGKEIFNCLIYYNGVEFALGHKFSPFVKIPPYDYLCSIEGDNAVKRKFLPFEKKNQNNFSEKLVHPDWIIGLKTRNIICLKIITELDEKSIQAIDADCTAFDIARAPVIFIVKDDEAYDLIFQQSNYVGKKFPMLTIQEFVILIQALFFTHINSVNNSENPAQFFQIITQLALNYEKWNLQIQKQQAEKIMLRMGINPKGIEEKKSLHELRTKIPNDKSQYPQLKCPICGWVKPNLIFTTTCLNCQTGVIYHNNEWITVNRYIDPDNFLDLNNDSLLIPEGKNLLNEQKAHLKGVDEMNSVFRTMKGPSPFESVRVDGPMKFFGSWINLGIKLKDQKQFEKSFVAFSHALNLNPFIIEAWDRLGTSLFEENWCYPGYKCILKAYEIEPKSKFIQNVKSGMESIVNDQNKMYDYAILTLQKDNNFPKGIEFLKLYLQKKPHDFSAVWLISEGYNWIRKYKQAKFYYSQIFESKKEIDLENLLKKIFPIQVIRSKILNSKLNYAAINFNEKNYRKTIEYCNEDYSGIPNNNNRLLMFGASFYKLKEFKKALRFLDKINISLITKNDKNKVKEIINACKENNGNIDADFRFSKH
jgi:tetratricopeptide (TPR) repeat protein